LGEQLAPAASTSILGNQALQEAQQKGDYKQVGQDVAPKERLGSHDGIFAV
jgi:hypothetical protein